MAQAKSGDTVKVHYVGKLPDGTVFDTSENREPLEFTLGQKQLIPGFEKAVVGMEKGDQVTVNVAPEEAYGQYDEKLIQVIGRETLPQDLEPEVGQLLEGVRGDGQRITVSVLDVNDTNVTLDANHPLAGKDLVFDITLVEIL